MPVVIGLTIYAYVDVFVRMMKSDVRDIAQIPQLYASVNK